ncbi:hypothetical protein bsdtb5_21040 [Anaeromicropila herbilytica]|uniref:N-acetyltransferase domain-containing protein n=1 Tax=Anaeromicropila herbilytica TaxID=2785025 RepID=A0A7R7EL67_9FIRM|nr:GNAT family N-acetyltransferase [Anaeromicropila herbilytica]BCN30809.1 hypothetical protein bsdtb5_21040 [Anaeromicropila herbilytica]
MKDVYEQCPILEDKGYLLRLVEIEDAKDLLKVYSDEKAVSYFNSDNCNDNFYYQTLDRIQEAIQFWIWSYQCKAFVRWSIIDKSTNEAIGTIELFHRDSKDYFNACALLRLDLRSDYENDNCIESIVSILLSNTYDLFHCNWIATKAAPFAKERIQALELMGFHPSEEKVIGHDGTEYGDYWVCTRDCRN